MGRENKVLSLAFAWLNAVALSRLILSKPKEGRRILNFDLSPLSHKLHLGCLFAKRDPTTLKD